MRKVMIYSLLVIFLVVDLCLGYYIWKMEFKGKNTKNQQAVAGTEEFEEFEDDSDIKDDLSVNEYIKDLEKEDNTNNKRKVNGADYIEDIKDIADYKITGSFLEYDEEVDKLKSDIVTYDSELFNIYEEIFLKYAIMYYNEKTKSSSLFEVEDKEVVESYNTHVTVSDGDVRLHVYFNINTEEILIKEDAL